MVSGLLQSRRDEQTPRRRPTQAVFWRRRLLLLGAALVVLTLVWAGIGIGAALVAPGTDSAAARVAEWARSNHLGWVVDRLEVAQYNAHPPQVGGSPVGGVPRAAADGTAPPVVGPAVLAPVVSPALPGEGKWQTVAKVGSRPAVEVAYLRPDTTHTSYLDGVMWMDPALLRFALHPGTLQPGGSGWSLPPYVPASARATLLATFNSGFTLSDSRGGYYQDGRTVAPLRTAAASLVLYRDGTATVGSWGRDVTMSADVAAVRQNLDLMVDGGQVVADIDSTVTTKWGKTIGNKFYVWRSGLGITATGKLVYVAGPALSTRTLAELLQRAGSVRAMELDINPDWVSGMWYVHSSGTTVPHKLNPDASRPANRYFSVSSRDFVTVSAR
jgi:Phosphodiester glycosidase